MKDILYIRIRCSDRIVPVPKGAAGYSTKTATFQDKIDIYARVEITYYNGTNTFLYKLK